MQDIAALIIFQKFDSLELSIQLSDNHRPTPLRLIKTLNN